MPPPPYNHPYQASRRSTADSYDDQSPQPSFENSQSSPWRADVFQPPSHQGPGPHQNEYSPAFPSAEPSPAGWHPSVGHPSAVSVGSGYHYDDHAVASGMPVASNYPSYQAHSAAPTFPNPQPAGDTHMSSQFPTPSPPIVLSRAHTLPAPSQPSGIPAYGPSIHEQSQTQYHPPQSAYLPSGGYPQHAHGMSYTTSYHASGTSYPSGPAATGAPLVGFSQGQTTDHHPQQGASTYFADPDDISSASSGQNQAHSESSSSKHGFGSLFKGSKQVNNHQPRGYGQPPTSGPKDGTTKPKPKPKPQHLDL